MDKEKDTWEEDVLVPTGWNKENSRFAWEGED